MPFQGKRICMQLLMEDVLFDINVVFGLKKNVLLQLS